LTDLQHDPSACVRAFDIWVSNRFGLFFVCGSFVDNVDTRLQPQTLLRQQFAYIGFQLSEWLGFGGFEGWPVHLGTAAHWVLSDMPCRNGIAQQAAEAPSL
jgi:hypothetical protein